jgi:hypothetical protein
MKNEAVVMVPYRVEYQIGGERKHFSIMATDSDDAFFSVRDYLARFPGASVIGSPVRESR